MWCGVARNQNKDLQEKIMALIMGVKEQLDGKMYQNLCNKMLAKALALYFGVSLFCLRSTTCIAKNFPSHFCNHGSCLVE